MSNLRVEKHPISPFYPAHARWLFLGSFPPKQERWAMDFFYPNFQNDMWRIFGLIFFGDKNHFVDVDKKTFHKAAIITFLTQHHIAMYDTAAEVIRHKDNASDKDLEIVSCVDIIEVIKNLPDLQNIVTTGQKASETLIRQFALNNINITSPAVGSYVAFTFDNRHLRLFRMPSSSRAYPLALEKKAEAYKTVFLSL
ncbi:MAG: uracil-DNA glycosylase family protein [Bacteroidales bacterium]|jgi:G:T/U-mismatch repair DNA glycosylase|nr:uracil-DNA glycosylase family protein [Bacteroidales bacterium]